MHFFTSITANYLPKARVLARSIKRFNPTAVFHLVLSDAVPEWFSLKDEPFDTLIRIQDLGIPDLDSWIFKHSVVELCTAVKGQAFLCIFENTTADKVVYFDPDIVVLNGLEDISDRLNRASALLTPHQVEPDTTHEAIVDNEICSLKHGIYNLGFLAVKRSREGLKFLTWWRDRLNDYCYDDIPGGLFTDQRWMDLAPAFFDDIMIVRDKTYNVATWNISHRKVLSKDDMLMIDGEPVKFFHFSGFDSGAQKIMLEKYAGNNAALWKLRKWYVDELEKEGQQKIGQMPCAYSFYSNGEPIDRFHRLLYRSRGDLIEVFPHPAQVIENADCFYLWLKHAAPLEQSSLAAGMTDEERLLARMLNSRSWRITEPLRKIGLIARKLRRAI